MARTASLSRQTRAIRQDAAGCESPLRFARAGNVPAPNSLSGQEWRNSIERLFGTLWEERTLVKTWAMRGTLHLLPSEELPMWHAALGTSKRYLRESAYFGITLKELDRLRSRRYGSVPYNFSGNSLTDYESPVFMRVAQV